MAEDMGEKTEKASPRKRQDSRSQGTVPKSQDLSGALLLSGAMALIFFFGPFIQMQFASFMRQTLGGNLNVGPLTTQDLMYEVSMMAWTTIKALAPVLGLMMVVAYLSSMVQIGLILTTKPLHLKLSPLNPVAGVKKLFGLKNLVKAGASVLKIIALLIITVTFISLRFREILTLGYLESGEAVIRTTRIFMDLVILLLLALLILGIIDFVYQKWQWERDNRMSKQETKEERKMTMGDEKVKQRQRNFAQTIVMQRMQQMVPQADVIVTNPEHLAIAIKWDPDSMDAPKVLAKGADHTALRIRQIALAHRIPILERKPLARAMYPIVRVGHGIPSQFYQAVAEVLAYVYRLQGRKVG